MPPTRRRPLRVLPGNTTPRGPYRPVPRTGLRTGPPTRRRAPRPPGPFPPASRQRSRPPFPGPIVDERASGRAGPTHASRNVSSFPADPGVTAAGGEAPRRGPRWRRPTRSPTAPALVRAAGCPGSGLGAAAVAAPSQERPTDEKSPETPGRQLLDVGPGEREAPPRRTGRLRRRPGPGTRRTRARRTGGARGSRPTGLRHRRPRSPATGSTLTPAPASALGLDRRRRRAAGVTGGIGRGGHRENAHRENAHGGESHRRDAESPTEPFHCHALIPCPHQSLLTMALTHPHRAWSAAPIYVVARTTAAILGADIAPRGS